MFYPCFVYLCLLYMDRRSHSILESGIEPAVIIFRDSDSDSN